MDTLRREINGTGIGVYPIGLGAMPLSIAGRPGEAQAFEVIKAFVEAGGDFIDTANVYCLDDADIGHNEQLIAKALERLGERGGVTVATKGGLRRPKGEWTTDGHPASLRASCEKSLRDLNTGAITLYQLHAVDPAVDLAESLAELIRLKEEGKILHIGLSNITPRQLEQALAIEPIASVQNRCNVLEQTDFKNGMVALCHAKGVAYIPHSPVGGHFRHVRLRDEPMLTRLGEKYSASAYQIALAWFLHKGQHILPIPGASKPKSILDSLKSVEVRLAPEEIAALDRLG
ncbi:MAG: aldo/keto reductase [Gammaproteobacteria bacterium]